MCSKYHFFVLRKGFSPRGAASRKNFWGMPLYGKNLISLPGKITTLCENVSASKHAIIHIQVNEMDGL